MDDLNGRMLGSKQVAEMANVKLIAGIIDNLYIKSAI